MIEIESWAYKQNIIPDPKMPQYQYYRGLADLFSQYRPDLRPRGRGYFSAEALAKVLTSSTGRYDKDFIGHAIRKNLFIERQWLTRSYGAVSRLIPSKRAQIKGHQIINKYTSFIAALKHSGTPIPVRVRLGLYGVGWGSVNRRTAQTERLRLESYGLDWVTGYFTPRKTRHHIEYDKSVTDDDFLIYTDFETNDHLIPHPPSQNYFGEPVKLSSLHYKWVSLARRAKESFGRGEHNPMWLDSSSAWYHPAAARRFYWGKLMVSKHGPQWLDTPLAAYEPPPWFLSHLNSNPLNIQLPS